MDEKNIMFGRHKKPFKKYLPCWMAKWPQSIESETWVRVCRPPLPEWFTFCESSVVQWEWHCIRWLFIAIVSLQKKKIQISVAYNNKHTFLTYKSAGHLGTFTFSCGLSSGLFCVFHSGIQCWRALVTWGIYFYVGAQKLFKESTEKHDI